MSILLIVIFLNALALFFSLLCGVFCATMPLQPSLIFASKARVHRSVAPYDPSHGWYSCFTIGFGANILDYQFKMTQNLVAQLCAQMQRGLLAHQLDISSDRKTYFQ